MRKLLAIVAGLVALGGTAIAQPVVPMCPMGFKPIGRVCLSADQQHAVCLYPDAVGKAPKSGTPSEVNPASCPRHAPGQGSH